MSTLPDGEALVAAHIAGIPVRNLWLLMLYASELFRTQGPDALQLEANQDEIPDLVAELLAHAVDKRRRRSLSPGYEPCERILSRVRGRIDLLTTERRQLRSRGLVACRFQSLTVDTPRNRFVRGALLAIARLVRREGLAHRCRVHAHALTRLGVSSSVPSRKQLSADRFGHHDAEDRYMLAAARLAFDLALPTELPGSADLQLPEREVKWVRKLYERAVGGFYKVVLPHGWCVRQGRTQHWAVTQETAGIASILPQMCTDVVLVHPKKKRRIVIDTKFTSILIPGWHRDKVVRSAYLYQIYSYLRSQAGRGKPLADRAAGLLLHPSLGTNVDETVVIQGHPIRFATVDLAGTAAEIRARLLHLVDEFPFL